MHIYLNNINMCITMYVNINSTASINGKNYIYILVLCFFVCIVPDVQPNNK